MNDIQQKIEEIYGNKLRIRVGGICVKNDQVLLVKHVNLGKDNILWAPPGGGIIFGESAHVALQREFLEETGLTIVTEKLLFVNEYIHPPLHAVELFFLVKETGGNLKIGTDPEMQMEHQIIQETAYLSFAEIKLGNPDCYHSLFAKVNTIEELKALRGYFLNGK